MKPIVIAIDGYSGTGKSSTAKQVASRLNYQYIDSGAMYRAVTYCCLINNLSITDSNGMKEMLKGCEIRFEGDSILLNGQVVDNEIRTMEVNELVSTVSTLTEVRMKLVEQQRAMGVKKGVVMDGRDIGTVVFPEAELKVFMTADVRIRAERRMLELTEKGIQASVEEICENLMERDRIDSTRQDSPLIKAEDAITLDTSRLTLEQQVEKIVNMAEKIIHES